MFMRTELKTIRLRSDEARWVKAFLQNNRIFNGFSDLGRLAVLDFIQRRSFLPTHPISLGFQKKKRPSFLWDYDLDVSEVKAMLVELPLPKKMWLIARILEHARFSEVWKFLTPEEIKKALPQIRMNSKRKKHWEYALEVWSNQ